MIFDDEKVRRNLVVASTTVLATYYLGLPIGQIVAEQLVGKGYAVDSLKFTELGFAVFIYLGLMFRFSEAGKKYSNEVKLEGPKLAKTRLLNWSISAIRKHLTDRTPPGWKFSHSFVEPLDDVLAKKPSTLLHAPHNVFLNQAEIDKREYPNSLRASLAIHWTPALNTAGNELGTELNVELSRPGYLWLRSLTFLERHFYTETAVQCLFPVVMGNLAVMLMVYKVLDLYLGNA